MNIYYIYLKQRLKTMNIYYIYLNNVLKPWIYTTFT